MSALRKRGGMIAVIALISGSALGCTMSETGQRTVSGGLIGAGGGALLGAIGGNAALGAAVGAGAGAIGGFLYDQGQKSR